MGTFLHVLSEQYRTEHFFFGAERSVLTFPCILLYIEYPKNSILYVFIAHPILFKDLIVLSAAYLAFTTYLNIQYSICICSAYTVRLENLSSLISFLSKSVFKFDKPNIIIC